jgi:hypothetical protein
MTDTKPMIKKILLLLALFIMSGLAWWQLRPALPIQVGMVA